MKDVSDQLQLKNYLSNFNVSLNGRITTDLDTINNIAQYVSTPVMLLTCQDIDKNAIFNVVPFWISFDAFSIASFSSG